MMLLFEASEIMVTWCNMYIRWCYIVKSFWLMPNLQQFAARLVDFFQWIIVVPQQIVHLTRWWQSPNSNMKQLFESRLALEQDPEALPAAWPWFYDFHGYIPRKTNPAVMTSHLLHFASFRHIKPTVLLTAARTVAKRFQASAQEGSRVAACRKPHPSGCLKGTAFEIGKHNAK